jgi:curved DNA-binding protein CbpA
MPDAPACLAALGLTLPCAEADVKRVYRRKARSLHPDAGGDAVAFRALTRACEDALAFLARANGGHAG